MKRQRSPSPPRSIAVTGVGSEISCTFDPPIDLGDTPYEIGLSQLYTYHNFPNVTLQNNKLTYITDSGLRIDHRLEEGIYEFSDIMKELLIYFNTPHLVPSDVWELPSSSDTLLLTYDKKTMRTQLHCQYTLDLTADDSIARLLGFSPAVLPGKMAHTSDGPIRIVEANVMRVDCNVADGIYLMGSPSHPIYEFYPRVGAGYKVQEVPRDIVYYPLLVRTLDRVTLRLEDQRGRVVPLHDEELTITLRLKPRV